MRIGIDIGGVLSKFPEEYKALIKSLVTDHEVFIVTDMSYDVALKVCQNNNILDYISEKNILCADWAADQDNCKAKIYQKYKTKNQPTK
jgi:phosphoglycolate phosphatase-like HAD superfamily hydrolase